MTIHWSLFGPGVLLLLFPADRLLSPLVQLRSFDCFQTLENSPRYRPWWWVPALWLDPVRGFVGALLLKQSLALTAIRWALVPKTEFVLLAVVLAAGVLCQTFTRRGDHGVLLAPIGFVAGVIAAVTPWPVALLGTIAGLIGLFAFRHFGAFFACGLVAVSVLGLMFDAGVIGLVPALSVLALPVVTGFLRDSSLELPTRDASRPRRAPPEGSAAH